MALVPINETSIFARKNYFYPNSEGLPDLTIRQAAGRARVHRVGADGAKKDGITRVHMEEDAGKSLHDGFPDSSTRQPLI
jgi:aspartyl-tRNA(Asn)/glutamyl-tRNA(Gln) amidotransferase subunit B